MHSACWCTSQAFPRFCMKPADSAAFLLFTLCFEDPIIRHSVHPFKSGLSGRRTLSSGYFSFCFTGWAEIPLFFDKSMFAINAEGLNHNLSMDIVNGYKLITPTAIAGNDQFWLTSDLHLTVRHYAPLLSLIREAMDRKATTSKGNRIPLKK